MFKDREYPSDLSDQQWRVVAPLLPKIKQWRKDGVIQRIHDPMRAKARKAGRRSPAASST